MLVEHRFGDIVVKTVSQYEVDTDITGRELQIAGPESSNWRKVMHYQYHAWPDHGVPESTESIRKLCRAVQSQRVSGDPIVHCSAGNHLCDVLVSITFPFTFKWVPNHQFVPCAPSLQSLGKCSLSGGYEPQNRGNLLPIISLEKECRLILSMYIN